MSKKKSARAKIGKEPARNVPGREAAAGLSQDQSEQLLTDLRKMIESARHRAAAEVNSALVVLYWHVGERMRRAILGSRRAAYGKQIVATVSRQLTAEFGGGFTTKNLMHMTRFAEVFPDLEIVSALRRQLSWTHFKTIIYVKDPREREFYAEMCRIERWSTIILEKKIQSMCYERTALSRKPEILVEQELAALREEDRMTPDLTFRDTVCSAPLVTGLALFSFKPIVIS